MVALVNEVQGLVTVERHLFSLVGVEAVSTPEDADWIPWQPSPQEPGFLYVESAGEDHDAQVILQMWDGEPARDASSWETAADLAVVVSGDSVQLATLTGGPAEMDDLSVDTGTYHLRACCRGRRAIADILSRDLSGSDDDSAADEWPEGVEVYLFQFWPRV
ncbi:hypothetical protein [Thermomonospora umbrina]|uniref:Immunity protein 21 of polymorphic toxin system n=1 Tax=Thermomonospora umbrina TaxID=111806 RepID=A0A3D9T5P8_9ACTN|nr:hypothetical protein [Thermomonospora umbrina]REF00566.1 hypothetical protein DFJ69_6116 [Thermomonospora umbrina]